MERGVPRGPVHGGGQRGKKARGSSRAFEARANDCQACLRGDGVLPCTCVVQDRCGSTNDAGHQCILGVGHALRHVTAAGKHFQ